MFRFWRRWKRGMLKGNPMDAEDFRDMALSFDGAEEGSHMGSPDFRVGGHIFATLAMQHLGFGNLMLSPELQQALIAEAPEVFLPIAGGWGRMGCTHIRFAEASANRCSRASNSRGACASIRTTGRGLRDRDEDAGKHSLLEIARA